MNLGQGSEHLRESGGRIVHARSGKVFGVQVRTDRMLRVTSKCSSRGESSGEVHDMQSQERSDLIRVFIGVREGTASK